MTNPEMFFVGAYWPRRREPRQVCARRCLSFLGYLVSLDRAFAQWLKCGESSRIPDIPVVLSLHSIEESLSTNKYAPEWMRDNLGYTISLWNGAPKGEWASILGTLGSDAERVRNALVLDFPHSVRLAGRVFRADLMMRIVEITVSSFEPEYACVLSPSLRQALDLPDYWPCIGWVTYLSPTFDLSRIPAEAEGVKRTSDRGVILTATNERFSSVNPEHLAAARRIVRNLKDWGVLQ